MTLGQSRLLEMLTTKQCKTPSLLLPLSEVIRVGTLGNRGDMQHELNGR